jgi:hypothetical protein
MGGASSAVLVVLVHPSRVADRVTEATEGVRLAVNAADS